MIITRESVLQRQSAIVVSTPMRVVNGPAGPRLAPITVEWYRARLSLQVPSGYSVFTIEIDGAPVDVARNATVEQAKQLGVGFLFFLDYDVIPPPFAIGQLLYRLTATHTDYDIAAGVYCVKSKPPIPIIYREQEGPFWDWTPGDVLTEGIVGVPMGCTMIRMSLFDKIPHSQENPWFKTDAVVFSDTNEVCGHVTEDIWFCRRAREAGAKILVDTSVLCWHIDNDTGTKYGLPEDSPPIVRLKAMDVGDSK